jgi:hypothetical protein
VAIDLPPILVRPFLCRPSGITRNHFYIFRKFVNNDKYTIVAFIRYRKADNKSIYKMLSGIGSDIIDFKLPYSS